MSPEALFSLASSAVLPGWLLLVFLPRWKWTARLIVPVLLPLGLGLVYSVLVLVFLGRAEGGFGSLAGVSRLFEEPYLLVAGWIHYLAFDLFVGAWEVRDAQRAGIPHLPVVPCLLLTFLLGPVGLLLYLVLRGVLRRRLLIDEEDAHAVVSA